ncbi:MAG: DNA polymerase-1 [Alphaproteobacteria bacterium]|jgi:DNA polymerase-1
MTDTAKSKPESVAEKLYLIDGSGFIFRAFHSSPLDAFRRTDGIYTNAVAGYCGMLLKLIDQARNDGAFDYMAVIFDAGRKTFRNDIYPEYKANRDAPPEELVPQFELVREATRAFNLPAIQMAGFEADDLIATYARHAAERGIDVVVVSSDKDLMQLVQPGVSMLDPMKDIVIGTPEVAAKFGVAPDKVIDVQALAGDSTDNVPGVPGIGVKTAALLINEYGDLDTLLARAAEIKQTKRRENLIEFADLARVSRELVTLKNDIETEEGIDDFALKDPDPATVIAFLKEMEFRTLTARVESRFVAEGLLDETTLASAAEAPGKARYQLVQDEAALAAWIDAAYAAGTVAVDTETTSLNAMQAQLVGFSLSTTPGNGCYVPVGHVDGAPTELDLDGTGGNKGNGAIKQIPLATALAPLKTLIEDPAVLKIAHNAKYDLLVLTRACEKHLPAEPPLAPAAIDDTMLLSYVLDAGRGKHNLDDLASRHLSYETIKFSQVAGSGKTRISFAEVALDAALDYAAEDADITLRLHRALKPRLATDHLTTLYETTERPLVPVIVAMERAGIKVDAAALTALSKDFGQRTAKLEEQAHLQAGEEFNIGSPKQLGEILFDKLGIEGGKKGKAGAFSTGADILEDLAAQGHDLPRTVLDWRQLAKLKSTYTDALVEQINPDTGRIHTSYGMAIAQTGRLSSNDPNLQNIPVRTEEGRKIRAAFVAVPGHKLVSLDYSQIELRVLAHVAGIGALIEAFEQGVDIHALTASQVFDVPLDELGPDLRRRAKAINFGIIYGISAFGLARNLGIARSDAQAYIDAYFVRFPEIRTYMDETIEFAKANGYVETLFGRRIHLSGIGDKNQAVRGGAERQAINAPIQGAAADIIKRAMIRMPPALTGKNLAAKMLLQVHDELLFEVPDGEVDATIEAAREVMETAAAPAANLAVPLVADAGVGDNWNEAH